MIVDRRTVLRHGRSTRLDEGFVYAQAKASVLRRLDRHGRTVPVQWPVSG